MVGNSEILYKNILQTKKLSKIFPYYGFNAYQYNPTQRDFEHLSSNKISIPNTIFIRNLDLAKMKVMGSPSFKIGSNFY